MKLKATTKAKIKAITYSSLSGTLLGAFIAAALYQLIPHIIIEGALIGLLITAGSSFAEVFWFSEKFRDEKFTAIIIKRSAFYLAWISFSILLVLFVFDSIQEHKNLFSAIRSREVKNFLLKDFPFIFLLSILVSYLINFFHQAARILGGKVILNIMLGKYNRPAIENRIFMFLDLKSSTEIGESLGASMYSELLQDFFLDIAEPVAETGGEIYQYVGDEVILTWLLTGKEDDNNCIDCFFLVREKITGRQDYYRDKYGVIPLFKAGIHAGRAVVTEVGDLQREIVYHGDVLNTASRIQKECNSLNEPLLVSNALVSNISLKPEYSLKKIGYFYLKGKARGIMLYGVKLNNESLPGIKSADNAKGAA